MKNFRSLISLTGLRIGPFFSLKETLWPNAWGTTKMSENKIIASISKRLSGCNDIVDANLGVKQRSKKFFFEHEFFYIQANIYQPVA